MRIQKQSGATAKAETLENNKLCESAANNWNRRGGGILISKAGSIQSLVRISRQVSSKSCRDFRREVRIFLRNLMKFSQKYFHLYQGLYSGVHMTRDRPICFVCGSSRDDPGTNWGQGGP